MNSITRTSHSIRPNPQKFFESLRSTGLSNYQAISDIIDNSIDAGASVIKIKCGTEDKEPYIYIADNGEAMDKEMLIEALKVGAEGNKDRAYDLGTFGFGLKVSSLSISRCLTIFTKQKGTTTVLKAVHDLDDITERKDFIITIEEATTEEVSKFEDIFKNETTSGTVVYLTKCDKLNNKDLTGSFKNILIKEVGQTFRKFLDGNVSIFVNDRNVEAIDPLFLSDKNIKIYEKIEIPYRYEINDIIYDEIITFQAVKLNEVILNAVSDEGNGGAVTGQGIYVIRNNREVNQSQTWGNLRGVVNTGKSVYAKKHPDWNYFRAELSFNANLDALFNTNLQKTKVELCQSLGDVIHENIKGLLKSIKAELKSERTTRRSKDLNSEITVQIKKDQTNINSKANILKTPKVPKEKRKSPVATGDKYKTGNTGNTGNDRNTGDNIQKGGITISEFGFERNGDMAPIFRCYQNGRKIIVMYNEDHLFVQKALLSEENSTSAIRTLFNFLFYSLASAHLQFADNEQTQSDIEWVNNVISFNTRTLLK